MEVAYINVEGATALSSSEIEQLSQPYTNRCITLVDINNLLRDITNAYIDKGYVTTRAFISPDQNSPGGLQVMVIEGKIEKVIINQGNEDYYWRGRTAFPGLEGELLNLRDIEQGLDQLNRLPSNNAVMDLEPGESLGGTIINVSMPEAKSWKASMGVDNLGQRSTGKHQYSLSLIKDNFVGIGDQFSVFWNEDLFFTDHEPFSNKHKPGHNNSFSSYLSIPYGYWTFSANMSKSKYKTTIFGLFSDYITNGDTELFGLHIDRVIHRDADGKTTFGIGLNRRAVDTYIAGFWLESSSYKLTTLQISLSHSRRLFGGLASGALTWINGVPWLGATRDPGGSSRARTEFDKYSLNLSWYRPLQLAGQNLFYSFSGFGQLSPQKLYGPERIQIGGQSSVRGFHEESITGNQGAYFRNELGWNLPWFETLKEGSTLNGVQVYVAYDFGFIHKNSKDSFERGQMQGVALGMRTLGDLSISLTIGKAMDAPDFVKKKQTELYASVSYTF
jgi:hemolysin activation/secretion protein